MKRCRYYGRVLDAWLPVAERPQATMTNTDRSVTGCSRSSNARRSPRGEDGGGGGSRDACSAVAGGGDVSDGE
jgi:hypothetical protein